MGDLKKILQNKGENIGFNAKMFLKSHDITYVLQIILLFFPILCGIISLSYGGIHGLDVAGLIISVFSLIYFMYFGKNLELYMERGNKYIGLYSEIETYYKSTNQYHINEINKFNDKLIKLNNEKKPEYHIFAKYWVNAVIEKEFTYANEKCPWWKTTD